MGNCWYTKYTSLQSEFVFKNLSRVNDVTFCHRVWILVYYFYPSMVRCLGSWLHGKEVHKFTATDIRPRRVSHHKLKMLRFCFSKC